jgi:hypothetical protein
MRSSQNLYTICRLKPTRKSVFKEQVVEALGNPRQASELVEATVITHYRRAFDTYYIKAEGEVDIAYVDGKIFWPVEIKWARQIRPKDLKQISKYSNSKILAQSKQFGKIQTVPTIPLPIGLLRLCSSLRGM